MDGDFPTLVDLFCGAGGLSTGFQQAGFSTVWAADHWKPAVDTYERNVGNHVRRLEIIEDLDVPSATVIAGGPPCQGFSSAGRRCHEDERNSLVRVFAQIVARNRPRAFLFENVEGFLTGGNGKFVIDLLEPLIEAGYRVHLRKINAANFGVPQHRKRVIAVGGLFWNPTFPEPTHTAHGAPGAHLAGRTLPLTPSVTDALAGLLPATSTEPGDISDHVAYPLEGTDLERAMLLKPGQTMRDLPEQLWHESYRRRAFRRVMDGTPTERRGGAPSGMRRLRDDQPSKAITGGALRDFLHPHEHRSLTVRECARLQTFEDTFTFIGSRADRMLLVGNAVPPRLATVIASQLLIDLAASPSLSGKGELLSFVPTLSTGMSPALATVVKNVTRRFGDVQEARIQQSLWR
jgi:DNA (cytosine-5)-methyltransferase 1